jgi:hypothetical protein
MVAITFSENTIVRAHHIFVHEAHYLIRYFRPENQTLYYMHTHIYIYIYIYIYTYTAVACTLFPPSLTYYLTSTLILPTFGLLAAPLNATDSPDDYWCAYERKHA